MTVSGWSDGSVPRVVIALLIPLLRQCHARRLVDHCRVPVVVVIDQQYFLNSMSNLVVIGFPKVEEAEQVRLELVAIQEEHLITLEDAVVLEHGSDGHVHLRQAINMTATGAMGGSFWGLLVGLIFANPLLGLAAGAGAGAASGALSDIGINDKFLKELAETLPQGSAALALLVRDSTPDRVIERLRRHVPNARLVHTSLRHTNEEKLKEQLEKARKQADALRMA